MLSNIDGIDQIKRYRFFPNVDKRIICVLKICFNFYLWSRRIRKNQRKISSSINYYSKYSLFELFRNTGLMVTLSDDLPKSNINAILGIIGYDPYLYCPHKRACCMAIALDISLNNIDIAFRAYFASMKNDILVSYNTFFSKVKVQYLQLKK